MEVFYPYFLIVHLFCVIIFLGYIFLEILMLNQVEKYLGKDFSDKMWDVLSKRGQYMPIVFLLLILTGGAMISRYIGGDLGYFETTLQQFLVIKAVLALILASMVAIGLFCYYVLRRPSPFGKIIHPLAFAFGIIIVILAKLAFYF